MTASTGDIATSAPVAAPATPRQTDAAVLARFALHRQGMDAYEFEKIYPELRDRALRVVWKRVRRYGLGDNQLAEDAVQDATVYILTVLPRLTKLTRSYFTQKAVNALADILKSRGYRVAKQAIGDTVKDIVVVEEIAERKRRGRKLPRRGSDSQ